MKQKEFHTKDFPKILILGYDMENTAGGGVTLRNIFKYWPKEKVLNAYDDFNKKSLNKDTVYQYKTDVNILLKIFKKYFKLYKILLNVIPFKTNINFISREFKDWIDEKQPDVIYAFPYKPYQIELILQVIEELKIPVTVHIVDNWINFDKNSIYNILIRNTFENKVEKLFKSAYRLFCISNRMKAYFETKYNVKFNVMHNSIETNRNDLSKNDWTIDSNIRILYTGSIEKYNIKELILLGEIIEELNSDKGIKFDLYGVARRSRYLNYFKKFKSTQYQGVMNREELISLLPQYDILYLPMGFEKEIAKKIELSMPTKISEYMQSGTPILLFSPNNLAVFEYAKTDEWAFCVDKKEDLISAIARLSQNKEDRKRIGNNAIRIASEKHDILKTTSNLLSLLRNDQNIYKNYKKNND